MEHLNISLENLDLTSIRRAADVLRGGGIVLYPTETCYGLGVDARNQRALARLTALKGGRDDSKRYSVIARDLDHIETLAVVDDDQRRVLSAYLPGPYTFILVNADFAVAQTSTLGIRWPKYPVTQALSDVLNDAYVTTSVNLSGQPAIYDLSQLKAEFLDNLDPALWPDLVLDVGPLPVRPSSAVIDLTQAAPKILRTGPEPFVWPK